VRSQVNIAQFHPIPGNGIVYGTKRGKVKVFYRHKYEPEIEAVDIGGGREQTEGIAYDIKGTANRLAHVEEED
jgi:hypothetical protein